jgi:galactose mutarotase-like enzyme
MQQHGFARNVLWEVASTSADQQPDDRDPCVEFVLKPSEYSKKMFPFKFKVVYTVTLHGQQLQTQYRCEAPSIVVRTSKNSLASLGIFPTWIKFALSPFKCSNNI